MVLKDYGFAFRRIRTPFYFYDMELLESTLSKYTGLLTSYGYVGHYAIKANFDSRIIESIRRNGLGVDCVSGNEVKLAVRSGFDPSEIVFAGVGKSDGEIRTALKAGISCFNCESIPEIKVIDGIAGRIGAKAGIALRINPDIDAHTHKYISTGRSEDKFGISPWSFQDALDTVSQCRNVTLTGLHFHIGSQITDLSVFKLLCNRVNELQQWFTGHGAKLSTVNLGGGLGVDYENPDVNDIPPFEEYFGIINRNLEPLPGQQVHFETGRALVAQCGSLISRVLYVKIGKDRKFLIIDAGMNDLLRPALYGAYHRIDNLSSEGAATAYDVVGPVCESSDRWGDGRILPLSSRGDMIAIRSAGAYGQAMAMRYNCRSIAKAHYSDTIFPDKL